jgi:elongation factor 1-beta
MANVLVTIKVMPESPEVNRDWVSEQIARKVGSTGKILKTDKQPIAFGLSALLITILMDESKGSTERLEKDISALSGVSSVDVIDVRRAVG